MSKQKKNRGLNRHQARESILEVLYAWQSGGYDMDSLPNHIDDRIDQEDRPLQDVEYLREAVAAITGGREALDTIISSVVKRSLRSVAMLELNILRIAVWEMQLRLEIPFRIIINESLELSRDYSGEIARGFINGVVDKLAAQLRADEFKKKAVKK